GQDGDGRRAEGRAARRAAEGQVDRPGAAVDAVLQDRDGDGGAGLARAERHVLDRGEVVGAGVGAAVGRAEVDGDRAVAAARPQDRDGGAAGGLAGGVAGGAERQLAGRAGGQVLDLDRAGGRAVALPQQGAVGAVRGGEEQGAIYVGT